MFVPKISLTNPVVLVNITDTKENPKSECALRCRRDKIHDFSKRKYLDISGTPDQVKEGG